MGYLVEFIGKQKADPVEDVFGLGLVAFKPNPEYEGRRVVELKEQRQVENLLKRNPPGEPHFVEPSDLVTAEEHERLRQLVRGELRAFAEANNLVLPDSWDAFPLDAALDALPAVVPEAAPAEPEPEAAPAEPEPEAAISADVAVSEPAEPGPAKPARRSRRRKAEK